MTPDLVQLVVVCSAALAYGAAVYYLTKRYNRSQPKEHVPAGSLDRLQTEIEKLAGNVKDNTDSISSFNLKVSELEEFVTRNMNRMSARHSKMTKKEEEQQQMLELLQQSKELDQGNGQQQHIENDPNYRPRLRRNT